MNDETMIMFQSQSAEQLTIIDEEKLPKIFQEQVRFLEDANSQYKLAKEKEIQARAKVSNAMEEADRLIEAAQGLGDHTARKKKFLWHKYTSKKDEIDAVKENLKELIDHSEDSAKASKQLAEVQSTLLETQTSLLHVQKAQMEYERQIAEATKFVFGLSAYNMASSQSVLIKLKAILEGASKEQLGELAQQQLFLALDQIKNQENIINRLNENELLIENLNAEIEKKQAEITAINELGKEQNKRIDENEKQIEKHTRALYVQQQKDAEHDEKFRAKDVLDARQDQKIEKNTEKIKSLDKKLEVKDEVDDEQDEKIAENARALIKHDEALSAQQQKDAEHDEKFRAKDILDESQDQKIIENAGRITNLEDSLKQLSRSHQELIHLVEEKLSDISHDFAEEVATLKSDIDKTNKTSLNHAFELSERIDAHAVTVESDIGVLEKSFDERLNSVLDNFRKAHDELKTEMVSRNGETDDRLIELANKISNLEMVSSKKIWKIVVSVVAAGSLILNILQIIGVL